jgi:hypothetical protein
VWNRAVPIFTRANTASTATAATPQIARIPERYMYTVDWTHPFRRRTRT